MISVMSLPKNAKISWDKIFDFATEDVSLYLWALKSWTDPPDGYEQDYLLLQILNSCARSRSAISLMKEDMPSEYHRNRDKLNKMWQTGEKIFFNFVRDHHKDIEKIILEEFTERLSQLEQDLNQIKKIAQDGDLMDDPKWLQGDLKETTHEFLLQFQSMANSNEEIQSGLFLRSINSEKFTDKFKQINGLFKGYFGYFNPVSNLLAALSEREYDRVQWWLARYPEPEDIEEDETLDMLLETLRPIFQKEEQESDIECQQSDNAIAYAFDELSVHENNSFKDHMLECHFCYDLVQDTRIAEIESKEIEDKPVKMMSAFAKAVNEPKTENSPGAIMKQSKRIANYGSGEDTKVVTKILKFRKSPPENRMKNLLARSSFTTDHSAIDNTILLLNSRSDEPLRMAASDDTVHIHGPLLTVNDENEEAILIVQGQVEINYQANELQIEGVFNSIPGEIDTYHIEFGWLCSDGRMIRTNTHEFYPNESSFDLQFIDVPDPNGELRFFIIDLSFLNDEV